MDNAVVGVNPMIEHACAWHVPSGPSIAQRARTLTRCALDSMEVAADEIDVAELMVSELATNSLRHAAPPYGLRIWCAGQIAVVEMFDASPALPALPCTTPSSIGEAGQSMVESTRLEECGRGLPLISSFSNGRCGSDSLAGGKKTWFAVSRRACEHPSP
ncbi:ATP-binding protein [Nocardiopsis coralliicola]